jgi:hypothetical protein
MRITLGKKAGLLSLIGAVVVVLIVVVVLFRVF